YPQFSWLPPTPVNMFSALSYDLIVAEILPGQTAAEAIQNNTPVHTSSQLRNTFQAYPGYGAALKEGQPYAWRIIARNGLNYAAQTETWSFVIAEPQEIKPELKNSSYISLSNGFANSDVYTVQENLLIKYYSFDKDH